MDWIISRLKEPSTWSGIISVLAGFGIAIDPELAGALVGLAVAGAGVVAIVIKERKPKA